MQCPYCGIETTISRAYTEVTGDKSPDTPTQVFTVQELTCRNPQCARHGQLVQTVRHLSYSDAQKGGE